MRKSGSVSVKSIGEWNERKEGYPLMIKANVLRILTMLIRAYQDETKSGGNA